MSTLLSKSYLMWVVASLSQYNEDDPILRCSCDKLDVPANASTLLELADQKLHVFPFKDVNSCWFRLYTDASIAKAIQLILTHLQLADAAAIPFGDDAWIDEAVATLDMALIMAGGMGREDTIHELLRRFQDSVNASRACTRTLDHNTHEASSTGRALLPGNEVSLPSVSFPIPRLHCPSLEDFQVHMNTRKEPLVLTGILDHWPALDSWRSPKYWLDHSFDGRRLVPIEQGRSYVDDDWGQSLVPFKEFLDDYVLMKPEKTSVDGFRTGYLAQHDLLKQIPSLHDAIATPDYCYLEPPAPEAGTPVAIRKAKERDSNRVFPISEVANFAESTLQMNDAEESSEVQTNIWFGPPWTISPLHHDPYHNILCQVVGKKYIRLFSPHVSSALHPRRNDEPAPHVQRHETLGSNTPLPTVDMSNTSLIDIAAMEISPSEDWDSLYPGLSAIPYVECILEAGQALYIPIGWWHYVRSCSVGISVSFWW